MTINEAIIYAEEMAATDGNRKRQDNYNQIAKWLKDYKRMLQQEPCEDCISRQAAIDAICKACSVDDDYHKCDGYPKTSTWCDELVALRALPSVTPQPKTGRWIHDGSQWRNRFICSECGYKVALGKTNYCPNCGCHMVEPQERDNT